MSSLILLISWKDSIGFSLKFKNNFLITCINFRHLFWFFRRAEWRQTLRRKRASADGKVVADPCHPADFSGRARSQTGNPRKDKKEKLNWTETKRKKWRRSSPSSDTLFYSKLVFSDSSLDLKRFIRHWNPSQIT